MQAILKLARTLTPATYALLMLYAVALGLMQPYCNWDMVGYVGSVVSWGQSDPVAIHKTTMTELKTQVEGWIFDQFITNPLSAEPKALVQQLPFYQIKPLYTGSMWLLSKATIPLAATTWWVSALSFAALALLLYRWRTKYLPQWGWLWLMLALSFLGEWPLADNARFSTPDSLCMAFFIAAIFGWLVKKSLWQFCLFGWLSMLARPDSILVFVSLSAYFAVLAPKHLRMDFKIAAAFILAMAATYLSVSKIAGGYSWERMFIYAFVDKATYPAEATDHLTFDVYFSTLMTNFWLQITHPREIVIILFTAFALFAHHTKPMKENRLPRDLLLLMWLTIGLRFLLFPAWGDERYYYPYYIIILYACGELSYPYLYSLTKLLRMHKKIIEVIDEGKQE